MGTGAPILLWRHLRTAPVEADAVVGPWRVSRAYTLGYRQPITSEPSKRAERYDIRRSGDPTVVPPRNALKQGWSA
jgi:hypothetical protein